MSSAGSAQFFTAGKKKYFSSQSKTTAEYFSAACLAVFDLEVERAQQEVHDAAKIHLHIAGDLSCKKQLLDHETFRAVASIGIPGVKLATPENAPSTCDKIRISSLALLK